jgi:hypothetical protein
MSEERQPMMIDQHGIIKGLTGSWRKPSIRINRMRRRLRRSGIDRKIYIVLVGIVGIAVAMGLYDLLFAVFPMKLK